MRTGSDLRIRARFLFRHTTNPDRSAVFAGEEARLRGVFSRRRTGRKRDATATGQEILDEEEPAFPGASNDAEESLHAGHLFELFVDEPLEEVPREVILVTD